jgi:hypothetical protein
MGKKYPEAAILLANIRASAGSEMSRFDNIQAIKS